MNLTRRAGEPLTIQELVDLLAPRVAEPGEPMRQTKDKVRKRLLYAREAGDLPQVEALGSQSEPCYRLADVVYWARSKCHWRGKLDGLEAYTSVAPRDGLGLGDTVRTDVVPGDLPRCQQALTDCHKHVRALETQLTQALAEVDRLRPFAERYEAMCKRNGDNARKAPRI